MKDRWSVRFGMESLKNNEDYEAAVALFDYLAYKRAAVLNIISDVYGTPQPVCIDSTSVLTLTLFYLALCWYTLFGFRKLTYPQVGNTIH